MTSRTASPYLHKGTQPQFTERMTPKENGNTKLSKITCIFFQRGKCKYGNGCRFKHELAGNDVTMAEHAVDLGKSKFKLQNQPANGPRDSHANGSSGLNSSAKSKVDIHDRAAMDADLVSEHLLNVITSDLKMWAASKSWPLSCYGPVKYLSNLQGFQEMSAEEVRLAGMQANAEGRLEEYFSWLSEICERNNSMVNNVLSLSGETRNETLQNLAGFLIQGASGFDEDKSLLVSELNDFDAEMREL